MGCEKRPYGLERVAADDPSRAGQTIEAFGPRAFAAHDRHRVGGEKGVAAKTRAFRGAIEKKAIGKRGEQPTGARRVGSWNELLDDRGTVFSAQGSRLKAERRRPQGVLSAGRAPLVLRRAA